VAALAAAGCGGSSREDAQGAVDEYLEAVADGDSGEACELLSRGARHELEDRTGDDCEAAMEDAFGRLEEKAGDLEELRVKEVNAARDIATATIEGPNGKTITELTREGGDWKLSSAPGG